MQLFELQVEYGFMLSLKWVPTAENGIADAISRPSRGAIVRIAPAAFETVWDEMGPFDVDLMACTASVARSPLNGGALPFFSQHDCAGSAGEPMCWRRTLPSYRVLQSRPLDFVSQTQS